MFVLLLINLCRINVVLLAVINRWEEKEFKRKRRINSGLELRILTALAFFCKCLLYSVFFKIPVCQRILSLVKLKWFKLLVKLGLSFSSDAYKVF